MTYEKEIPEYAMVPAKEMEERVITPVGKEAVYTEVQLTNISQKPKTMITIEEDILVPDTKPDLARILLIDGTPRPSNRRLGPVEKGEDSLSLSGEIELQTLYLPEKQEGAETVISVQTRVPFQEQCHIALTPESTLQLEIHVEKIEYMVINERKYRVKIFLALCIREYVDRNPALFESINGEEIQTRREKIEMTNVAQRRSDTLHICEDLDIKTEYPPEAVLCQSIAVVENYKQVTEEKVVISGFVCVNLLYRCREDGEYCEDLHQAREKVEFTQFIPLHGGGVAGAGSQIVFDGSDLRVKPARGEDGEEILRLEGDLLTEVEIYRNTERAVVVDAYHREKDFLCDYQEEPCCTLIGTTMGEASLREIFSPELPEGELARVLYTEGRVLDGHSRCEQGKIVTEGKLSVRLLCLCGGNPETAGQLFSVTEELPFRVVTSLPQLEGSESIREQIFIKELWAEKINGKQLECSANVLVMTEVTRESVIRLLTNPAFAEGSGARQPAPMVIYIVREGDQLWEIAKKYKSTVDAIIEINQLAEENPRPGQKLLILK